MRLAGRVSEWSDDKGYGFVIPNGGGTRAFVHINEFQRTPPPAGRSDLLSAGAGCAGADAGQGRPPRGPADRGAPGGALPVGVAAVFGALSVVSYFMYAMDKSAANASRRRIPENQLHLFGLLGGWPGALVAQQQFRHKTAKASFRAHEALAGALH